ncbi:MAG: hypothetical protein WCF42_10820 [Terriglobales bacterium]
MTRTHFDYIKRIVRARKLAWARWRRDAAVALKRRKRAIRNEQEAARREIAEFLLFNPEVGYREAGELFNIRRSTAKGIARASGLKRQRGRRKTGEL